MWVLIERIAGEPSNERSVGRGVRYPSTPRRKLVPVDEHVDYVADVIEASVGAVEQLYSA